MEQLGIGRHVVGSEAAQQHRRVSHLYAEAGEQHRSEGEGAQEHLSHVFPAAEQDDSSWMCNLFDEVNEGQDQGLNDIENLRDVSCDIQNKILAGSLSDFCGEGIRQNFVVQIIDIMRVEEDISVIISDGNHWLKCSLDEKYYGRVGSGELKQFDIIKNVVLSGEVTTEIVISDLCRPRSIQMKVPKLIGNPVPCEIVQTGKLRNKRKMGNNRGPMPRVDELFDDSVSSRYY